VAEHVAAAHDAAAAEMEASQAHAQPLGQGGEAAAAAAATAAQMAALRAQHARQLQQAQAALSLAEQQLGLERAAVAEARATSEARASEEVGRWRAKEATDRASVAAAMAAAQAAADEELERAVAAAREEAAAGMGEIRARAAVAEARAAVAELALKAASSSSPVSAASSFSSSSPSSGRAGGDVELRSHEIEALMEAKRPKAFQRMKTLAERDLNGLAPRGFSDSSPNGSLNGSSNDSTPLPLDTAADSLGSFMASATASLGRRHALATSARVPTALVTSGSAGSGGAGGSAEGEPLDIAVAHARRKRLKEPLGSHDKAAPRQGPPPPSIGSFRERMRHRALATAQEVL
jgi:hypothetical protein